MKHRVHKFKLRAGKDANDMLLRKLATNFLMHGTMITTEKKGKSLCTYMARLVEKAKERTESNKNYLLHHFNSVEVVNRFFDQVGPALKDVQGGYLTLKRLQQRYSDGAMMVQLGWSKPVVIEEVSSKSESGKTHVSSAKATETEVAAEVKAPKAKKSVKKAK